jgi:beta-N-acetylhexosaminidase
VVDLDFAPIAHVIAPGAYAANGPTGQQRQKYRHDPATVANHVLAVARGMAPAEVATTVKHFPGLGRVRENTDVFADTATTPQDP